MSSYLDQFATAEEFIHRQICANRGTKSAVMKDDLVRLAVKNGIDVKPNRTKEEIYRLLRTQLDLESILCACKHIGVRAIDIQQRFGITHPEVKQLEKSGFLRVSGYETVRMYGKYRQVPLYDPCQVYELTAAAIYAELHCLSRQKEGVK